MTGTRIFAWLTFAIALLGCGFLLIAFGALMLQDASADPLPAAVEIFGRVYFVFVAMAISGAAYIACRLAKI